MGKHEKTSLKKEKAKVEDYVSHLKYNSLQCRWDPSGTWRRTHGDNKSSAKGEFSLNTMMTSGSDPTYKVKIMQGGHVAYGPVNLPNKTKPTDDEVVTFLKSKV